MSSRVFLRCYPKSDRTFSTHTDLTLTIELPDNHTPDQVVAEVVQRLRETYPLAEIHVDPVGDGQEEVPTWHVYRDGLPATGGELT